MAFFQKCKPCTFEKTAKNALYWKTRKTFQQYYPKNARLTLLGIESKLLPTELYFLE